MKSEENMQNIVNILVVGHVKQRLEVEDSLIEARLKTVFTCFKQNQSENVVLKVLTGVTDGVDTACIKVVTSDEVDFPVDVLTQTKSDLDNFERQHPNLSNKLKSQACLFDGQLLNDAQYQQLKQIRDKEVLNFSDLLLVVWDGSDTLEGGTLNLVLNALRSQQPVIWLNSKDNLSTHVIDADKADAEWQARLNLPLVNTMPIKAAFKRIDEQALSAFIQYFVKGVAVAEPLPKVKRSFAGLWNKVPSWLFSLSFKSVKKTFARLSNLNPYTKPDAWQGPEIGAKNFIDTKVLDNAFVEYDVNAAHFADRHRDSVFLLYFLSALAVFSAVSGAIYLGVDKGSHAWGWVEVAAISAIGAILLLATRTKWHQRWVRYRFIAEQIRYAKVGLILLQAPKLMSKGFGFAQTEINKAPSNKTDAVAIAKRVFIAQGLPVKDRGTVFVSSAVLSEKANLLLGLIKGQIAYHHSNAAKLHTLHHRMHRISFVLFVLTVIAVIAHFFVHASWLLIFTAALPAFAAGLHGILTKLELAKVHNQSHLLYEKLETLFAVLNVDIEQKRFNSESFENYLYLRAVFEQATVLMSQEAEQWQELISTQEPELPA
ncbi:MAG: hypothetical protein WCS28_06820 [Thiomicrospira sp.]